jgi:hypothetical protein
MPANQDYLTITATSIRPRFGRVLVSVEKEYDDELTLSGGVKLYLDTSYKPLHHIQEFATVVATPLEMRPWDVTPCEVQVGERVRMHYFAICNENLVEHQGKRYWLVPYDQLYYVERPDGSVQMLGDYCLVEPVLTTGGEEKTAAGLITNLNVSASPRPVANRGTLRHRPTSCPWALGTRIAYVNDADLPLKVGEETFYLMDYRREILAAL